MPSSVRFCASRTYMLRVKRHYYLDSTPLVQISSGYSQRTIRRNPYIQSSSILPVAIALRKQFRQLSFSSRRGLFFLLLYGSRDTQATTAICPQCSYAHYQGDGLGVGTPLVLLVVRRESYNKISTSSLDR